MRLSKNADSALAMITAFVVVVLTLFFLGNALEPVAQATYVMHDYEQIDAQDGTIDLFVVGNSRVYRELDPAILEEELGYERAFVAGSAQQPIIGSYYMIKELIGRYHPKTIILGVSYNAVLKKKETLQKDLLTRDQMRDPLIRAQYALDSMKGDEFLYLLKAYRYRDYLDVDYIMRNFREHQELYDEDGNLVGKNKKGYEYRGFMGGDSHVEPGNTPMRGKGSFSHDKIDEKKVKYLNKIVEICRKNDVELILVSGVTSLARMYYIEGYQDSVDYITQFARENDLPYYNLNYLTDRFELLPDEMMLDYNHTNGPGARALTKRLTEIIKADARGEDTSPYFYPTFADLQANVEYVVSLKADIKGKKGARTITITSLQNPDTVPEFRVLISGNGEDFEVLYDYTTESTFDISELAKGQFVRVEARAQGSNADYDAFQVYQVE